MDDIVPKAESAPRLRLAEPSQGRMITESLGQRLDADHPVRNVWAFVEQPERLYASIEGVGSARELDRLCREHHTLADFRVQPTEFLEQLFAQSIASLSHEGLVDVNLVAHDGKHARRKAAQMRAAVEEKQRLESAIENVREIAASREARKKGDGKTARASSTDPDARRTKMPDGGTRPALNAQFGTDVESGRIVGVVATNAVNDICFHARSVPFLATAHGVCLLLTAHPFHARIRIRAQSCQKYGLRQEGCDERPRDRPDDWHPGIAPIGRAFAGNWQHGMSESWA